MEKFQSKQISNKPILSLKSLLHFNPNKHKEYNVEDLKLSFNNNNNKKRKFLVCHDMKNNYLDDKYYQGSNESKSFEFYHWQYIDIFIYFSHHFVTIPPEQWINASHENNCRCLGTLITEWKDGIIICNEMLKDEQTIDLIVNKLVELCLFYKFDGWLINIENPIVNVALLILLCDKLTKSLKKLDSNRYRVIWYDSVIQTGELKWQNELNSLNECFFNVCDAIFINYTWKDENLKKCIDFSDKKRLNNIYIGVDVFGRGCLGDGGFNTNVALEKISEYNDLSCALFAPGWLHECNPIDEFIQNTGKFWNSLEKYVHKRNITQLPLITTFSHSRADKFFLNGKLINDSNMGWSNLSLQSKMPIYDNWCFDDAFYAGNCILIPNDNKMITLFEFNLELTSLVIDYVFKSESNSLNVYLNYNEQEIFQINNLTNDNNNNNNKDMKVIGLFESNVNDWKLIKCKIEFLNSNICLNSIQMQNISTNTPTKLGLLRMYDENKSTISTHLIGLNIIETKQHVFCLNNETYMLVYIEWNKNKHAKYYNVFIDDFLNNETNFKYIGSTRSNDYRLCLKLNRNKIKFNSNKQEEESNYSFRVNIQLVDHLLANLNEPMKTIMIKMNNGLDIDDNINEKFYDQIIYDFELF
jgi:mannosyl-glycoprotein endo-beta-N-acetylglucosaminidase